MRSIGKPQEIERETNEQNSDRENYWRVFSTVSRGEDYWEKRRILC
jgi:hypothetical protein